jgi:hypothetical protein
MSLSTARIGMQIIPTWIRSPRSAAENRSTSARRRAVIIGIFAMSAARQTRGRLNMPPPRPEYLCIASVRGGCLLLPLN